MARGANTRVMAAIHAIALTSGWATGPPSMRARAASTTCGMGLTFTKPRSHPGIDAGGANTELPKVSGRMIRNPPLLTDWGAGAVIPAKALGPQDAPAKVVPGKTAARPA